MCEFCDFCGTHSKEEHMTIEEQAGLVKLASPKLAGTTGELRDQALLAVAKALMDNKDAILTQTDRIWNRQKKMGLQRLS